MKNIIWIFILLVGFSFGSNSFAEDIQKIDPNWMTYYYFHKESNKLGVMLQDKMFSDHLDKKESSFYPFVAFIGTVFKENPSIILSVKELKLTEKMQQAVMRSLWVAGKSEKIIELFNTSPEWINEKPPDLSKLEIKSPAHLDMLWGAFMASGNPVYVKNIISTLDENKKLTGQKTADLLIRGAAKWSLGSNMMQHEIVNRVVHSELKVAKGSLKKALEEIIQNNAKNNKPFANVNGDFSAMLLVIDSSKLTEFQKPSSQGMNFSEKKDIKKGEKIGIKIVFAGMKLTDNLEANVTFDMTIKDANGNIYDGADLKEQIAIQQRVPKRFSVFDNANYLTIKFEPHDKVGVYNINAVLKDNISGKQIKLHRSVNLTE